MHAVAALVPNRSQPPLPTRLPPHPHLQFKGTVLLVPSGVDRITNSTLQALESDKSIEDAIQNAITRASKTIREMKWFEVTQTRGHIENGSIGHYQVTLRVGFTLEG